MQANFVGSQALTQSLVGQVRQARYLADSQGRIGIPLRLTGSLSSLSVKPDLEFVAQSLQRAAIGGVLDAAFGQLGRASESAPAATTDAQPGAKASPDTAAPPGPAEELLRKGISDIFGR